MHISYDFLPTAQITPEAYGASGEAAILFERISSMVVILANQGTPIANHPVICGDHTPAENPTWESVDVVEGTENPKLTVVQIGDLCLSGVWMADVESKPLANDGTPTIDHYTTDRTGTTIFVDRKAITGDTSGYYDGVVETGVIFSLSQGRADLSRLRALDDVLQSALTGIGICE